MKHSSKFVVVFLALVTLVIAGVARGVADDAADKATDIAQMKKVWEALMAFKKAKGALPDKLSELVPEFLPDPKVLLSPKDDGNQANGPATRKDQKHPSSYGYEWGPQPFGNGSTFKEVKMCQVEEYGSIVPLLRCFLHEKVLNVSHGGEFYETETYWETSPALKEWTTKHGLGPGSSSGKFMEITTTDADGKPLEGIRVKAASRQVQGVPLPDRTMTTNAEGKVRMPFGVNPSIQGVLFFSGDRHFAMPIASDAGGFAEKLTVKMAAARTVSGVIRNEAGAPVAGALIRFSKAVENKPVVIIQGGAQGAIPGLQIDLGAGVVRRQDPNQIRTLESEANGSWKLDSLPEAGDAKIEVTVSHPDYRVEKRVVGDGPFAMDVLYAGKGDITLRGALTVRGQLRDRDGKPIAKTTVFFRSPHDPLQKKVVLQIPEMKTDNGGAFEFRARVVGDCQMVALPKNLPPVLHKFALGDDLQEVVLTPPAGRNLSGRVLDSSGKPVPDVPILFTGWPTLHLSEHPVVATTGEDGRWTWGNAPPDLVRGTAILPSGRLWSWFEKANTPVEIKIPLVERE